MLPNGIEPGRVRIVNMENSGLPSLTSMGSGKNSPPVSNSQPTNLSADSSVTNSGLDASQSQTSRSTGK